MPDIMKFANFDGNTHYVFHPERLLEIRDYMVEDRAQEGNPKVAGCRVNWDESRMYTHRTFVPHVTARQMKRNIQEAVDVTVGFLKLNYTHANFENGRVYVNVENIRLIDPATITKDVDGKQVDIKGTRLLTVGEERYHVIVEHPPHEVAAQIRRVLKRLEQDEELCCSMPDDDDE